MLLNRSDFIAQKAQDVLRRADTSDPEEIAKTMGIEILEVPFQTQKGVYKVVLRNRFIFIKQDLPPVMRNIVLLHEIGHDLLHRSIAKEFHEFNIFDMKNNRIEYEANLFAAEVALPDRDILEYIYEGYDAVSIAKMMDSDINLVAIKVTNLNRKGYGFHQLDFESRFLKR